MVTDSNASEGIDVASGVLTLTDGTQIIGNGSGNLTVDPSGQLRITAGTGADTATGSGATLDGVKVTDNATGTDSNAGIDVASGILVLDDGTQITGNGTGTLTVDSGATLEITTGTGATLDGVIVDDNGTGTGAAAGIDVASGVLTLDGNTQIQGGNTGTLNIAGTGELKITTATGATLDGVVVTDSNASEGIDVASGVLTLTDGTQIIGNGSGNLTVDPSGQLRITAGTGADTATGSGATLDGVKVTDNATGTDSNAGIDVASASWCWTTAPDHRQRHGHADGRQRGHAGNNDWHWRDAGRRHCRRQRHWHRGRRRH